MVSKSRSMGGLTFKPWVIWGPATDNAIVRKKPIEDDKHALWFDYHLWK